MPRATFLDAVAALRDVDRPTLEQLAAGARRIPAEGKVLLVGRERGDESLFVLAAGTAAHSVCTPAGAARVVELHRPGELFGEESLCCARDPNAIVELLPGAFALEISGPAVRWALERSPGLARALLENLARRSQRMLARSQWIRGRLAIERLCAFLMHHVEGDGTPQALRLPARKEAIASYLWISAEVLSRSLAELARRRLIAARGREIEIRSPERLGELCGGGAGACASCFGCARGALWPG